MDEERKPTRLQRTGRIAPTYFEIKRTFKPLTIWQKFLLSPVGRWFATHDDLETWLLCATIGTFTGAALAPSVTGFAIGCTLGAGLLVYSWLRPRD